MPTTRCIGSNGRPTRAEAARRDVPILLSIGYAACHWCHVMAHESFEDAEVAAAANADFVCIKVDREERPDLDAVYMNATVAMTGQGGWPMTCFLTPDGRPFFCGTYYPKAQFLQLLAAVAETWRLQRADVEQASDQVAGELRRMAAGLPGGGPEIEPSLCDRAVAAILGDEDTRRGGSGPRQSSPVGVARGAAAHPRAHPFTGAVGRRRAHRCGDGARRHLRPAGRRVRAVQRGRRLGGAAFREDAVRQRAAATGVRALGAAHRGPARRVAAQTAAFLINDLADGEMFTSSLDADAAVRRVDLRVASAQLREVLGADDGDWAATVFAVTERGTFEHGASVLQLPAEPDDAERFERVRAALFAARASRVQPARDDKVVTAWNGLAITALAGSQCRP
jgi:uncharacterized protein YyaL (SSP411 family)